MRTQFLIIGCLGLIAAGAAAQGPAVDFDGNVTVAEADRAGNITPPALNVKPKPVESPKAPRVEWVRLGQVSFRFLTLEHAFRLATEPGTRHPGEPFFAGYAKAVTSLHGWADGDPFYVNYVGHPMGGSVAGYLWTQNDPRYWGVEFGKDRDYWRSRLRAAAFAWAYSEQFEIGPMSEASIGAIQSKFPQHGFVDHVVTPAIGLGWMIGEDVADKYIAGTLDRWIGNKYLMNVIRGALTPSRSMANLMALRRPWTRETSYSPAVKQSKSDPATSKPAAVAPFEMTVAGTALRGGGGPCAGGVGEAALRVGSKWQAVLAVGGCRMTGLPDNWSGDLLSYEVGPRWRPVTGGHWRPYAQVLLGGNKLTEEQMFPAKKALIEAKAGPAGLQPPDHAGYTKQYENSGFAISAGTGVDVTLNGALGIRVASLEYNKAWVSDLPKRGAPNGFSMSAGLVLRMGTW